MHESGCKEANYDTVKLCYPIVELLQVDDRAGLSLLSRLVGAIAVVVGHRLGPLVRVAIQAAIACKANCHHLTSSKPQIILSDISDSTFPNALPPITINTPSPPPETPKTLQKPPTQHGFGGQEAPYARGEVCWIDWRKVCWNRGPFSCSLSARISKKFVVRERQKWRMWRWLPAMAGASVAVDTEKPVIRSSTGVSRGLHPPCHGGSSNRNILQNTVSYTNILSYSFLSYPLQV